MAPKKLHIDIETFSSVDLKTGGVYKYVESLDFEILMIAYAFDDQEVQIVDTAKGEVPPKEFTEALHDSAIEKWAHNANFERQCFKAIGQDIPIKQWFCSAVKAAYCGLPLGLDGVSQALKLEDKAKSWKGKDLIKYFAISCKPTKTNGQRSRNYPWHNEAKWEEFKSYCKQDVEAEREVARVLSGYHIPKFERENYILDQEINDRGIEVDLDFAAAALKLNDQNAEELNAAVKNITGVDNPGSPAQLKKWLSEKLGREVKTLAKDSLPGLIEEAGPGAASDVLHLRQKAAKTSIKKYNAMQNCTGEDGRARGLFQFYGANRTGRWAGRLIQLQNLPRNYARDLETVREIVETGDYDFAKLTLGNVADYLSQLIRTAFVAKKGHTFAVADYSAIEARVIAWLAGEEWRLDVFNSHGKIYEASAAMMFNKNVDDIGKGSMERQAGKVAELALGYQGGDNALRTMGKGLGLKEQQVEEIIELGTIAKWRKASPAIVKFWKDVEKSAKDALRHANKAFVLRNLAFMFDGTALRIKLPSGRCLFYWSPSFGENRFGNESIIYKGMDQTTKKWGNVETYGGKLVENIVQAVARDLLVFSMQNLNKFKFEICMHVHDEAICEISDHLGPNFEGYEEDQLEHMCKVMACAPEWADGLPLNADGYLTPFYKKD